MTIPFDPNHACCFTGHRIIPQNILLQVKNCTEAAVRYVAEQGYLTFISGGALGFDTIAAQTVLKLRETNPQIRLIMALPCKNQDLKWSPAQKEQYQTILSRADHVICLSDHYFSGCMHQRNRFMVDNSRICIAYLTSASGGTAYTVRYAETNDVSVVNIAELTEQTGI